tara:strand:+ start:298 stop:534 length:237 start_codon:yes stop_codon:yes gene_type:complete
MKIGDLVRMIPKAHHPLWQGGSWKGYDDPWKGEVGIITSQYPEPDEELFIMMTHDPSQRSIQTVVVQKEDVEVLNENR